MQCNIHASTDGHLIGWLVTGASCVERYPSMRCLGTFAAWGIRPLMQSSTAGLPYDYGVSCSSTIRKKCSLLSNFSPHQTSVFPRILHPPSPNQFKRQRLKQTQRIAAAKILGQKSALQMQQGQIAFFKQMIELAPLTKSTKDAPTAGSCARNPACFSAARTSSRCSLVSAIPCISTHHPHCTAAHNPRRGKRHLAARSRVINLRPRKIPLGKKLIRHR